MPQYNTVTLSGATSTVLDITTETLIKAGTGALFAVSVTTAGTSNGFVYDSATVGNAGTTDQILNFGSVIGKTDFATGFPYKNGLVVNPGTGQVVSVAYR